MIWSIKPSFAVPSSFEVSKNPSLKLIFEDKLINEDEYNHLRKSALKISKNSESIDGLGQIRSISREKLTELRSLFNERLIDQDEYDDLRKNLIEI